MNQSEWKKAREWEWVYSFNNIYTYREERMHFELCIWELCTLSLSMVMRNSLHLTISPERLISMRVAYICHVLRTKCHTWFGGCRSFFFFGRYRGCCCENNLLTFQFNHPPDNHCYALTILPLMVVNVDGCLHPLLVADVQPSMLDRIENNSMRDNHLSLTEIFV